MNAKHKDKFYVYVLLDPRKPGTFKFGKWRFSFEPFYVGKGKGDRYRVHVREAKKFRTINRGKCARIRNILKRNMVPIVLRVKTNMLEGDAYVLEADLVSAVGRRCTDEGPLFNLSLGGAGSVGSIRGPLTNELKKRIAATNRATWAGKSEAEIKAWTEKRLATFAKRSAERSAEVSLNNRKGAVQFWTESSKEKLAARNAKVAQRQKDRHARLSPEDKVRLNVKQWLGWQLRDLDPKDKAKAKSKLYPIIDKAETPSLVRMKSLLERKLSRLGLAA